MTDGVPLTPVEQEVLRTALARGYFETPRRISTAELAEEVEVSDYEITQHLRRAITKVLRNEPWTVPTE